MVSAAVEQSRHKANMVALGDGGRPQNPAKQKKMSTEGYSIIVDIRVQTMRPPFTAGCGPALVDAPLPAVVTLQGDENGVLAGSSQRTNKLGTGRVAQY